jgi:excisionase family DNA binding protein
MKCYSVSEAAKKVGVNRATLQRWVRADFIPAPKAEIVYGKLVKCWTEKEIAKIREFKTESYCGKGMDRRKGSRAKQKGAK